MFQLLRIELALACTYTHTLFNYTTHIFVYTCNTAFDCEYDGHGFKSNYFKYKNIMRICNVKVQNIMYIIHIYYLFYHLCENSSIIVIIF